MCIGRLSCSGRAGAFVFFVVDTAGTSRCGTCGAVGLGLILVHALLAYPRVDALTHIAVATTPLSEIEPFDLLSRYSANSVGEGKQAAPPCSSTNRFSTLAIGWPLILARPLEAVT